MRYRIECPECESHDTKRVHVEWMTEGVEETRICTDCPTQYTNQMDIFDRDVVTASESA